MTGRGRPRRAKSPDSRCTKSKTTLEVMKQASVPRCPEKNLKEEKPNGNAKEQKPKVQKKTSHAKEKPSASSVCKENTAKHYTEELNKQQSAATELSETMKTKRATPKDSLKTKQAEARGKATFPEESPEEMTKDAMKESTKAAKACNSKAESPGKTPEITMKTEQEAQKNARCEDKVSTVLYTTLEKLRIKRDKRSDAAEVINKIVKTILVHLRENTQCFKEVEEPLHTGSYYENLKISDPDEFDVMLPIPVHRQVNINPFGEDGAFYSVGLKRCKSPLQKFQETDVLSSSKMLKEFRDEVKKAVKDREWEVVKKKKGCPAVTLTTQVQSITISLDVVLSIVVKSRWPSFTNEGIEIDGWLGTKVKQEYKRMPYYLVPKYEGRGTVESDGVLAKDVWRVSFSHVEKAILKNHGSEKTCCEKEGARCCRKDCLKLLKHLLSLLKEKDSSLDKFCSYHAKTTLLHACCSRTKDSQWRASDLSQSFQLLLHDFVAHLEKGVLHNFFIPTQNLLSGLGQKKCSSLARHIKQEWDEGFPIFK